jgi:hypothetical protein
MNKRPTDEELRVAVLNLVTPGEIVDGRDLLRRLSFPVSDMQMKRVLINLVNSGGLIQTTYFGGQIGYKFASGSDRSTSSPRSLVPSVPSNMALTNKHLSLEHRAKIAAGLRSRKLSKSPSGDRGDNGI